MSLSIFLVWTKFTVNNHDINISVSENADTYSFTTRYDAARTGMVYNYLNKSLSPNQLGNSENDYFDATTNLPDRTSFYVKESPGNLKIVLDKRKNSYASYIRIKRMCGGIKNLLTGK